MKTQSKLVPVILSVFALWGCNVEAQLGSESSPVQFQLEPVENTNTPKMEVVDGRLIGVVQGVNLEVREVPYEYSDLNLNFNIKINGQTKYSANPGETTGIFIDGQLLKITAGELLIGSTSYGVVQPGNQVLINADGVQVNQQFRGTI